MTIRKNRYLLLAGLCAVVALNACTDDSKPASTASSSARSVAPGENGPIAEGTFALHGAIELSGNYSVLYPLDAACARLASSDASSYLVPTPTLSGDSSFTWTAV